MRRLCAALLAGALGLGLASCGADGPTSGRVIAKLYTPAASYVRFVPEYCGKGCSFLIPETVNDPATWSLQLRNKGQVGWVNVDQPTWDRTRVGTYWNTGGAK